MNMKTPLLGAVVVLVAATIYYIFKQNYEFLLYSFTLMIFIFFLYKTDGKFKYLSEAKWTFLIWLILHMLGAAYYYKGTRLYDVVVWDLVGSPYFILKFDQIVHCFCYVTMTLILFSVVLGMSKKKVSAGIFYLVLILAATGLGGVNELIEFSTVVMFNSQEAVGDYFNTLLDITFNFLGSLIAVAYLIITKKLEG